MAARSRVRRLVAVPAGPSRAPRGAGPRRALDRDGRCTYINRAAEETIRPAVAANTGLEVVLALVGADLAGEGRFLNGADGGGRVEVEFPCAG